ncbi:MAG: hypothetical protein FJ128_07130 [Deltaproteobacteria bacterium]|nr:hypothetical protein [Deltaproteobacteria bacterium]MBM4285005.1 hypothetical protein [Deltaproteobacteria bacterium]
MMHPNLAILSAYLASQVKTMERLLTEIKATEPVTREKSSHLGYLLHNLYSAMEDLFKAVARAFENRVEDPGRYHRELLKRMTLDIPGIRPALLSPRSHTLIDELRGFRHVFRHAYDYELDADKLVNLKGKVMEHWHIVTSDLDQFQDVLQEILGKFTPAQ